MSTRNLILIISLNTVECRQTYEALIDACTTSCLLPLGTTGSICRKSPPKTTSFPPKTFSTAEAISDVDFNYDESLYTIELLNSISM
jgi:hypothetical protein